LSSRIVGTTTAKPSPDLRVVDTSSTAARANNVERMIRTHKKLPSMMQNFNANFLQCCRLQIRNERKVISKQSASKSSLNSSKTDLLEHNNKQQKLP
jgi:hypothetical protein